MRVTIRILFLFSLFLFSSAETERGSQVADDRGNSFEAGDSPAYHIRTGEFRHGRRNIISAAYNGSVFCHTPSGKLIWQANTEGSFPFDVCVSEIDGNKADEVLVACANGKLYAFDSDAVSSGFSPG